ATSAAAPASQPTPPKPSGSEPSG
nr:ATP synthase beta 1 subunit, ATPase beta 1 {N-terminal} [Nicotiana sylvestris=tobacco, pollen, Peptide Mitochondrial Partial, 23 aa] [Nicotiana sylvestris]